MPMRVAIIGLGRVGLPLACVLAEAGLTVVGIDRDRQRVLQVQRGEAPFREAGLAEGLARVRAGTLTATEDHGAVADADAIVITVGTPVDDHLNPVLTDLTAVLDAVEPHLRRGQTLVLRSTVSPGTTTGVARRLERATGWRIDADLGLAFCPERIAEGHALAELRRIPQILGAVGPRSAAAAAALFAPLGVETLVTDPLSAELAKLFANMYRYVTFAMANEFMMIAEQFGSRYPEVRRLVNQHYPRGGLPGAGFAAGPCLYKDGFFLLEHVPFSDLISTGWRINENMPNFLVHRLEARRPLADQTIALLGMAFKADSDDPRQSLSFRMLHLLEARGARVIPHDPYITRYAAPLADTVARADTVVIAAPHAPYRTALPALLAAAPDRLVCDVWDVCGTGELVFAGRALAESSA